MSLLDLSPWFFLSAASLAIAAMGALIWSAIDYRRRLRLLLAGKSPEEKAAILAFVNGK